MGMRLCRQETVAGLLGAATAVAVGAPSGAKAQEVDLATQVGRMQTELAAQRKQIEEQARHLTQQQEELDRLHQLVIVAEHSPESSSSPQPLQTPTKPDTSIAALPEDPVGGSPSLTRVEQADAVLGGVGVLTRPGHFVLEPSLEYTSSSNNRLVFRGVELIPGIQVGLIEANNVARDTIVLAQTIRFGLTNDLEIEGRVPVLWRSDRTTMTQQRQDVTDQSTKLSQRGLGDIELGLRYQLNHPIGEKPILIGTFRVKSDTGRSPFAVPFDSSGVAQGLATGSGFWAVQPGLSFLLPSDPVVIFGGSSYLHQFSKNINRTVGTAMVGRVDPGDAIGANIGFGFALNPRFSFSLAYQHNYILPMRSEINDVLSRADGLQVGIFSLGMSYRLTERQSLNFGLEIGATRDAPDASLIVRLPFSTN